MLLHARQSSVLNHTMPKTRELPKLDVIKLGGYSLDVNFYLRYEYTDISEACEELPAIIEWVNIQLQDLTEQLLIKKQEIKKVEAGAFFDLRGGRFLECGYGKMTDASVEKAVHLEEPVIKVHEEYAIIYAWVSRLRNLQTSLQSKLELIRSTEATRRRLVDGADNNLPTEETITDNEEV